MNQRIILMCGIPGSGKSTETRRYVKAGFIAINKDAIIEMCHHGKYDFQEHLDHIYHQMFLKMVDTALKNNLDIVVDDINHTIRRRAQILSMIPWKYKREIIYFRPNLELNIENRKKENRGYPNERWENVITRMAGEFEKPNHWEGFQRIVEYQVFPKGTEKHP